MRFSNFKEHGKLLHSADIIRMPCMLVAPYTLKRAKLLWNKIYYTPWQFQKSERWLSPMSTEDNYFPNELVAQLYFSLANSFSTADEVWYIYKRPTGSLSWCGFLTATYTNRERDLKMTPTYHWKEHKSSYSKSPHCGIALWGKEISHKLYSWR